MKWVWSAIGLVLIAVFITDAVVLLAQADEVQKPWHTSSALFFAALTGLGVLLAWKEQKGVGAIFGVASMFCAMFAMNLGGFQPDPLRLWQLFIGMSLLVASIAASIITSTQTQNPSLPGR